MAAPPTNLMTFAEFVELPETEFRQELWNGVLVNLGPSIHSGFLIQQRIRALLSQTGGTQGEAITEFGFKPKPDFEYRIADAAFLTKERWESIPRDGYMAGAPELVVEVLSRSNTKAEMIEKEKLCLENGRLEFWTVDIRRKTVTTSRSNGRVTVHGTGENIPLFFGGALAVDATFS